MGSPNIRTSTPCVVTGEIQHAVLARFREIDANDKSYLNKTLKARDELMAFDYNEPDAVQIYRGNEEPIQTTFEKERTAKLEYQDDALYKRSTEHDEDMLSITPHTNLQTKLLELRPFDREDLFAKMYIRFVTESILYNIAMGYAEDVIKLEYGEINAYLTVKDLLILFLYCEGQLHGYFKKTKDGSTTSRNVKIPTAVYLTVPYKKQFDKIEDICHWRNEERYNPYVLNIIPDELTLTSEVLPAEAGGKYYLTNGDADKTKWKWVSDNGSYIAYDIEDSGTGRWIFSFVTGSGDTVSALTTYSLVNIPYWNWLCWHPDMVYADSDGNDICPHDADIRVTKFHYVMDDVMPNYTTDSYVDFNYTDNSLVHLIDKQATGFAEMWKEYMFSGLSRQHAEFLEIMDKRVFRGIVQLNLSPYETFKEHIENSEELSNILSGISVLSDSLKAEEYQYLADTVIKLLYPIESPYLIDSSLQMGNKINRITELLVSLCSYNVAWIIDPNAFGNSIIDCYGTNTLDVMEIAYGMLDVSRITETESHTGIGMGLTDKWCYDEIYKYKYLWDPENTAPFIKYLIIQANTGATNTNIDKAITRYRNYKTGEASNYSNPGKLPLSLMNQLYDLAITKFGFDPFTEYTRPKIIDEPTCHDCIDHQYIITSYIEECKSTIIADIQSGENDSATGYGFVDIVSLADSDHPRSLIFHTSENEMMLDINQFIRDVKTNRSNYSSISSYNDIVDEYGDNKVKLFLSMLFHLKFRDSTFASLMANYRVGDDPENLITNFEYDATYDYKTPSWGTKVTTKQHIINK